MTHDVYIIPQVYVCPAGHEQEWPFTSEYQTSPYCRKCFDQWRARTFPSSEKGAGK